MKLTYDVTKRERTLAERGLDFEDAKRAFANPHFDKADGRFEYGEQRIISLCVLDDVVVVIVWTPRADSTRIISMRRADRNEREIYYFNLDRS